MTVAPAAPYSRPVDDLFPEPPIPDQKILIGTSGYSFPDWIGPFYPRGMKSSDFLTYYARHFPCVEVNSTYYGIPRPRVMELMERKTPEGFRFVVKLHQSMTHDRSLDRATLREFLAAIEPLKDARKYEGLLGQFPWAFRHTPDSLAYLDALRDALPEEPLFVEFRHRSWASPEVEPWLRQRRLGFCAVDEPQMDALMPPTTMVTAEDAYVRFHGRNAASWWSRDEEAARHGTQASTDFELRPPEPRAADAPRSGERQLLRYDYDYSKQELAEWMTRIRELADKARRTYLFFNNCHAGQAARSAKLMQELVRQQTLGS